MKQRKFAKRPPFRNLEGVRIGNRLPYDSDFWALRAAGIRSAEVRSYPPSSWPAFAHALMDVCAVDPQDPRRKWRV